MNRPFHSDQIEFGTNDIIDSTPSFPEPEFTIERPTLRVLFLDVET